MEISDAGLLSSYQAVQLQTQSARVLKLETQTATPLKSSPSERVVEADLGLPSGNADIPLTSSGDIRVYTTTSGDSSGESSDENVSQDETTQVAESSEVLYGGLTEEEQELVDELKARDAEVRQHEQAHVAAAGSYVSGGIQYEYQTGPDGKQYAIGGHVNIDTSSEATPEATIAKAQQIQRAALAPSDPSPQDIKVAAQASRMLQEAQSELQQESFEESISNGEDAPSIESPPAADALAQERTSSPYVESDNKGNDVTKDQSEQIFDLEEQTLGVLRES